jgi:hypothetical protein
LGSNIRFAAVPLHIILRWENFGDFEVKTGYLVLVKILGEQKAMDGSDIDLRKKSCIYVGLGKFKG